MIDIFKIREDFPILSRKVNGQNLIYFDNAATSQTPRQVIDVITDYYTRLNSNIHRGVHRLSQEATDAYEEARIKIKEHFSLYDRNTLITLFMPLVENIARKFATSQQASGCMSILDLIQEGNFGLIAAVDRIEWDTINSSDDQEKTLKSFLSKRIKGAIRRGVDMNRGNIRTFILDCIKINIT